jgi:type III restriction enzyme
MSFKLEDLPYQRQAITSVVRLFDGQQRNYFDLQLSGDCYPNRLDLSRQEILANIETIIAENGISRGEASLCIDPDYCIEMETGTGKTLVYLRTIYELCREYGFTKFIILVPSVPIREGVLDTIESFRSQLERLYNIPLHAFEYDSKKLTKVKRFIEGTDLQVMVMTTHSFSADDNIINRPDRDDSPDGMSYWQALGKVRPVVIMDEPQEGMDTENIRPRLDALDSVARIRYSATHKTVRNLLYRLSPIDAYNQRLVKKIEVLSIAEINDEATLKLELVEIQTGKGAPKAKLRAWRQMATGFKYADTKWLKDGDSLEEATNNISYRDFKISHIRAKGLRGGDAMVKFHNGVELTPRTTTGDIKGIFRQQLYWLCYRHFEKVEKLKPLDIKPLSLIFIDRVANYMDPDGMIKLLFLEEFPRAYQDFYQKEAPTGLAHEVQAYYFAKTSSGEFTDNENSMTKQREIYDEILRDKEKLLAFDNPRQFIFSHSALGVGWDNPNVFNIATLNQTYSDIKKRQEIGRGLRICRNQAGQRIYDDDTTPEGQEINLLTVIPNESYQTFVTQYQSELRSHVPMRHSPKGKTAAKKKVTLNRARLEGDSFKKFWQRLSQRTDYSVHFDEDTLIRDCITKINQITLEHYEASIEINRIDALSSTAEARSTFGGEEKVRLAADFTAMDLIEELSENTALAYPTIVAIVRGLTNLDQLVRNPPRYLHLATEQINRIALEEMVRTIEYTPTGENYGLDLFKDVIETYRATVPTPNTGIYDHAILDSDSQPESRFANEADRHPRVRALLKLPDWYKIPVPSLKGGSSSYTPDFGVVISHKGLRDQQEVEIHLVVETKSTDNIEELDADERMKILCAIRHFDALGISANTSLLYQAPVTRFDPNAREEEAPYGETSIAMGFFAPRDTFGSTLQAATATPNPTI